MLRSWDRKVDLVYVDGKHDFASVRHDLGWARWLPRDAPVFVHDAFSSLGVTSALLAILLTSRQLTFVGRTGSLAELRVQEPTTTDRFRVLRQLPWWGRNLLVKVALRLRLGRLATALGHQGPYDPY